MMHQTFVSWRSSSPNQFVPEIVSPSPSWSGLARPILLFIFSKNPFLSLTLLTNATWVFPMLWFFVLLGSDIGTRKFTTTLYSVYLLNSCRSLTLSQTILGFYMSAVQLYKSFENTVGKGEIARNKQFLLFSRCFLSVLRTFFPFSSSSKLLSANSFSLEESKICLLVKS